MFWSKHISPGWGCMCQAIITHWVHPACVVIFWILCSSGNLLLLQFGIQCRFPLKGYNDRKITDALETILQFNFYNFLWLVWINSLEPDYLWRMKFWISDKLNWKLGISMAQGFPPPGTPILILGMLFHYPQTRIWLCSVSSYYSTIHFALRLPSLNFFLPHLSSIKWKGERQK